MPTLSVPETIRPSAAQGRRPGLLVPIAVAGLLAAVLPLPLPRGAGTAADEDCLALADAPSATTRPIAVLERCRLLYPDDVELLGDLARAYERAGAIPEARAAFQRALSLDPGYGDLRLTFARFLLSNGDASAALREAKAALAVQPNRLVVLDLLSAAQGAVRNARR